MQNLSLTLNQRKVFAIFPVLLLSFLTLVLNQFFSIPNIIFISPYFLAIVTTSVILLTVLLKGAICKGQKNRLLSCAVFLIIFCIINYFYFKFFTPKHNPLNVAYVATILLSFCFYRFPEDKILAKATIYLGYAIAASVSLLYLVVYWIEIPSVFNFLRANNPAQILLGILLAIYFLTIAKSRLDNFLRYLIKIAIVVMIVNYLWSALVLLFVPMNLVLVISYFVIQFIILALLARLLLNDNVKNIKIITACVILASLFPIASLF